MNPCDVDLNGALTAAFMLGGVFMVVLASVVRKLGEIWRARHRYWQSR